MIEKRRRSLEERTNIDNHIRDYYQSMGSLYIAKLTGEKAKYIRTRASRLGIGVNAKRLAQVAENTARRQTKTPQPVIKPIKATGWGYA